MDSLLVIFLYLIGIFWIVLGALLVFAPDVAKNKFLNKFKNAPLKKLSILPLAAGILLILSASYNRYAFFITILGLLGIIKGISFIAAPQKMQKVIDWWFKAGSGISRVWGIVIIIIGSIVLMGI